VILTVAGIAMISSAIGGNENLLETVPRQAIFAAIGLAVIMITAAVDYRLWAAATRPLYVLMLALLSLILAAGFVGFGSARWFNVGIVLVQPSELAKIVMILVLADYLSKRQNEVFEWKSLFGSLSLVLIPFVLVFVQPDLSTAIVLLVLWASLIWAAGFPIKRLGLVAAAGLLMPIMAWPLLADYQRGRVINFLFPDPTAQFGDTYNVNQALISIGSGGLFGQGYGSGTQVQLRFLKVRHTDFIFSAMAEEFGFFGVILFILLFLFVIYRCLRGARMARDMFGSLICYGVAVLLMFQGAFNIGMNLNLFPVSGLPLPFLSYGGSSLLTNLFAIGLVESVILRHKRLEL
jgi:rod shape determining protein RodA